MFRPKLLAVQTVQGLCAPDAEQHSRVGHQQRDEAGNFKGLGQQAPYKLCDKQVEYRLRFAAAATA